MGVFEWGMVYGAVLALFGAYAGVGGMAAWLAWRDRRRVRTEGGAGDGG